jgi:hypothetical protein
MIILVLIIALVLFRKRRTRLELKIELWLNPRLSGGSNHRSTQHQDNTFFQSTTAATTISSTRWTPSSTPGGVSKN